MKKAIILILLLFILTGCSSSSNSLDKTYSLGELSYNVSSDWTYKNNDGANYHYLSDGSMLFVSSKELEIQSNSGDKEYDYMKSAYDGFTASASDYSEISENYDSVNNILTASYTADYGNGNNLVNYYATVKAGSLYCIAFSGGSYSKEKQNELFNKIISTVVFNEIPTHQDTETASVTTEPEIEDVQSYEDIGITKDEIIDFLEGRLSKNGFPTISEAVYKESDIQIDDMSSFKCSKYTLINGIDFYFFNDSKTGGLKQFTLYINRDKLSEEHYVLLGYLNGSLPYLFEPDTYKDLDQKLDMNSDQKTLETSASGKYREYYFYKDNELSYFYVVPISCEIIPLNKIKDISLSEDKTVTNGKAAKASDDTDTKVSSSKVKDTKVPKTEKPVQVVKQPIFTGGMCSDMDFFQVYPPRKSQNLIPQMKFGLRVN